MMGFFFSDFFKKEKKESKTPTSFLMLEAKHDNSKATFAFSSINLSKVVKLISILNFRLMDMAKFNASLNTQ